MQLKNNKNDNKFTLSFKKYKNIYHASLFNACTCYMNIFMCEMYNKYLNLKLILLYSIFAVDTKTK